MQLLKTGLIVLFAVSLAGCGVRGSLEPPPGSPQADPEPGEVTPVEDRDFILDGLLL